METQTIILLMLATLTTSVISAVAGLAGGVSLLTILHYFFPYSELIPIHGVIQLISNSSRTFFLKKHVNWAILKCHIIGAPIGVLIAWFLAPKLGSSTAPSIMLAILIFYTVFAPKKKYQIKIPFFGYIFVGVGAGFLGIFTGAVGPFLSSFFIRDDLKKEEIVATMASMQIITHLLKIPVFLHFSFEYTKFAYLFLFLGSASILGSFLGTKILKHISTKYFIILLKIFLFISGVRIIYNSL